MAYMYLCNTRFELVPNISPVELSLSKPTVVTLIHPFMKFSDQ